MGNVLQRALWLALILGPAAGCTVEDEINHEEAIPDNATRKSDLSGDWIFNQTTVGLAPQSTFSFEGESNWVLTSKIRWEIQEDYLVGYESFEKAPGVDADAAQGTDPEQEGPVTGYVAPGTRCFEAASGRELDCVPNPATGERGHAGEPNVVCRDPQGQEVACFPYRGQILAIYSITRHFNQRTEGDRVVVDMDGPWYARDYMEVDWSSNLIEDPYRHFFAFLDDIRKVDNLTLDAAGRDAFHVRWGAGGEMVGFDFVNRLMIEPNYSIAEGDYQKYHECLFGTDCGPGELRLRTAYRKVDRTLDFEPRPYDNEDFERFPLFRSTRVGYDPYRGAQVANRSQLAQQFRIWKAAFERDADGAIARDEAGEPIRIPYAEREVAPIVFHLSGDWPVELISEAEGTIADYDLVMREAVAFLRDAAPDQTEDVVLLDYNGYIKRVDATGLEDECAVLVSQGMARAGVLSDGRIACELVGFVPSMSAPFSSPERDVEWDWDETAVEAVLGDLQHHMLHYVSSVQTGGPLGYGPSTVDPETGEVLSATPCLYGTALDEYATFALDSINLHNGRVRVEDFVAGYPVPTSDVTDASSPNAFTTPFDPSRFLRSLPADALARPRTDFAEAVLGEAGMARLELMRLLGPEAVRSDGASEELLAKAVSATPGLAAHAEEVSFRDSATIGQARLSAALSHNVTLAEFYDEAIAGEAARYKDRPAQDLLPGGPVWQELRRSMARNVLVHEVGHTFALRHNFRGSHDALNYPDEYWELRRENIQPAAELQTIEDMVAMSERTRSQLDGGMDAYAGSSVMEYTARFNQGPRSLGRFDRAAILYNYADAAEVFEVDPSTVDPDLRADMTQQVLSKAPSFPTVVSTRHYTQLPYLLGASLDEGLDVMKHRRLVDWAELRAMLESDDPDAPIPVPYETCSDDTLGAVEACLHFDSGADDLEIVRDAARRYELDYFFSHFRRDRVAMRSPSDQQTRVMTRYFAPMRNVYQFGADRWLNGYGDLTTLRDAMWLAGSAVAVNELYRILRAPEYGGYESRDGGDHCSHVSYEMDGSMTVPIGPGRRLESIYDQSTQLNLAALQELGSRYVRRAALLTLTADSMADHMPNYQDLGYGFPAVFSDYVDIELTDAYLRRGERINPRLEPDGSVRFTSIVDLADLAGIGAPTSDGCILEQADDDLERQIEVYYAAAFVRDANTLVMQNRLRVFRVGSSEQPALPAGGQLVSFVDPLSGVEYGANLVPAPWSYWQPGAGVAVVQKGREVAARLAELQVDDPVRPALEADLTRLVADAEFLRSTVKVFDAINVSGAQQ